MDAELKDRLAAGKELMKRLELSEDKMSDGGGIEIINDAPTD